MSCVVHEVSEYFTSLVFLKYICIYQSKKEKVEHIKALQLKVSIHRASQDIHISTCFALIS